MAQIAERINPNFEKIGSIKVLSSSKPTASEKAGLVFGGYAYSADVQANDGNGYSITIRVISKDGKYIISSKDLSAVKTGSKNIVIGNFTFFDFYLISYSIDKQVESSILSLTFKDKSIFMDKVFIGLFNHDYGDYFDEKGLLNTPSGILKLEPTIAAFDYKCTSGFKRAELSRLLNRVQTKLAGQTIFKTYFANQNITSLPAYLRSDAFHSKYTYDVDGVNGGYIILGREEINEELCTLPQVTYCFKDLLASLAYSKIPGIEKFNLGDNPIYTLLRKNYFGSLRSVLDSWGNDLGFKFYFQPKIEYSYKDYTVDTNSPAVGIENECIKIINLTSSSKSLVNLNSILAKYSQSLNKVIESLSESASLEGTKKNNTITTIRRNARTFNSDNSYSYSGSSFPLSLSFIPNLYGYTPNSNEFIIGGTLSNYDEDLRDIYHLTIGNYPAMGISSAYELTSDNSIISSLDFLKLFGPGIGESVSETLSNFTILLAVYDDSKHRRIKDWEKAVMTSFYNQYFMINLPNSSSSCNIYNNFSISYETSPSSERYSNNELPFADLLFDETSLKKSYSNQKYPPIFKAENPFDASNQTAYQNFASFVSGYDSKKTLTIINLREDTKARIALSSCLTDESYARLTNLLLTNSVSIIVCRKFQSLGISNISLDAGGSNNSVTLIGELEKKTNTTTSNCPKTICDQTLADSICGDSNTSSQVNSIDTGFLGRASRRVVIQFPSQSFYFTLPTSSQYKYAVTRNSNSAITYPGGSYVFGVPPFYEGENVLAYEVSKNDVPETITQALSETGIVEKIITFDEATGQNTAVLNGKTYHETIAKQAAGSVLQPFENKRISLTSTHVPSQLIDFVFKSPILNSMQFSLTESGFSTVLDFSSRPKQFKPIDSIFLTQKFLKTL